MLQHIGGARVRSDLVPGAIVKTKSDPIRIYEKPAKKKVAPKKKRTTTAPALPRLNIQTHINTQPTTKATAMVAVNMTCETI